MTVWTPERRARHRAAIQKWKPWAHSTGPRTAEGKHVSSRNAFKGGGRTAMVARFRQLLAHHRAWLRVVRANLEENIFSENELLAACRNLPVRGGKIPSNEFCRSNSDDLMLYCKVKEP